MALANRDQSLLWLLIALLVSAGAWFAWLTPTATAISKAMSEAQRLDQEKQLLTSRVAFLNATASDLASRQEDRRLVELAAPADGGIEELVAMVDAMATSSGLVLASLQPQNGVDNGNQLVVNLNVTGTFTAVQAFVKALEQSERPITVQSLSLASSSSFEGSTLVTGSFTVSALGGVTAEPVAVGGAQ